MSGQPNIIHELESALTQGESGRWAETLRRVTDLFVNGAIYYSEEQVALFDDVVGRLAAEVEIEARAQLADRLAPIPNAPLKTIRTLANDDEFSVAAPVLTQSPRLDEAALVEIATVKSQKHLFAISKRKELSGAVTDVLVSRGDRDVLESITGNRGARFTEFGYSTIVRRAEGDDGIATLVGSRPDLPRHLFLQLLGKASENVRKILEQSVVKSAREIQQVVESVASRIMSETAAVSREYHVAHALVQPLFAAGKLGEDQVDGFVKAGKFEETVVALALLCDISATIVERAMVQVRPETILILAKVANLSWPTTKSLLVFRSHGRGMSAHELDQCLTSFHRLKPTTAQQATQLLRLGHK